jgi:hypothetical protein
MQVGLTCLCCVHVGLHGLMLVSDGFALVHSSHLGPTDPTWICLRPLVDITCMCLEVPSEFVCGGNVFECLGAYMGCCRKTHTHHNCSGRAWTHVVMVSSIVVYSFHVCVLSHFGFALICVFGGSVFLASDLYVHFLCDVCIVFSVALPVPN